MKRILSTILFISVLFNTFSFSAVASENTLEETTDKHIIYVDGTLYDKSGNIIEKEKNPPIITPRADLNTVRNPIYKYTTGERLVDYLTGAWAKASSYSLNKTTTLSVTGTATGSAKIKKLITATLGISLTKTTSYSVGYTIPADSSRDSKLVHKVDFDVYDCEVWHIGYTQDEILSETKVGDGGYEKPHDNYIRVIYK